MIAFMPMYIVSSSSLYTRARERRNGKVKMENGKLKEMELE